MDILAIVSGILILGAIAGWVRSHRAERRAGEPPAR